MVGSGIRLRRFHQRFQGLRPAQHIATDFLRPVIITLLLRSMGLKVRPWKGITADPEAQATPDTGPSVDPAAQPSSSSSSSMQSLGKVPGGQGINAPLIQLNMYPHICAHHGPKAIA